MLSRNPTNIPDRCAVNIKAFFVAFAILSVHVVLSISYLMNAHFFAPDADRICMDGIFLKDAIKDLPLSVFNIYEICSTLLWVTNPFVYKYAQHTMLEIPTLSMCIVFMYYLYKYDTHPTLYHGVLLAIVVGTTLWTNQKSGFILLIAVLYPIVQKKLKLYAMKSTWISMGIISLFFIPLSLLTLWLGDQNLSQSVGYFSEQSSVFSNLFELRRTIHVGSNVHRLKNKLLLIYENIAFRGIHKDHPLELRLPIVGKTIQLRLNSLLPHNTFTTQYARSITKGWA